jgi:hypothetical protein
MADESTCLRLRPTTQGTTEGAENLFSFPWPGPGNSEGPVDPDGWVQVETNYAFAKGSSSDTLLSTSPWPGPGDSEA